MAEASVQFKRVVICRFLGIQSPAQRLEVPGSSEAGFSAFVNLVYGPNASGKTTTALAIQALIWPEACSNAQPAISGDLRIGEDEWRIDLMPGRVSYDRNGVSAPPPRLPSAETRNRYRLALHELLAAEDTQLAALVQNELNGGLDLELAAEHLAFSDKMPTSALTECRELREAADQVRTLKERQLELKRDEDRLAGLQNDLDAARNARQRAETLAAAVAWHRARDGVRQTKLELERFDPAVPRLNGDEAETLENIDRALADKMQRLRTETAEQQAALDQCAATGLDPNTLPSEARLKMLRSMVYDAMDACRGDIAELERRVQAAEARIQAAARRLGDAATDRQVADFSENSLPAYTELVRRIHDAKARLAAVETTLRHVRQTGDADENLSDPRKLQDGLSIVATWLRTPATPSRRAAHESVAWIAVAACGIASVLLALLVHGAWFAGLLAPAALAAWLLKNPVTTPSAAVDRSNLQIEYRRLGLPEPDSWSTESVHMLWGRLQADAAKSLVEQEKAGLRAAAQADAETIRDELTALANRRSTIAARHGLAADADDVSLGLMLQSLLAWQDATLACEQDKGSLEARRRQFQSLIDTFNARIEQFSRCKAASRTEAAELVDDLGNRAQAFREATQRDSSAARAIAAVENDIGEVQKRRDGLLSRVEPDLAETPDPELRRRAERRLPELLVSRTTRYPEVREAWQAACGRLAAAESEVRSKPAFDEDMLHAPLDELREELETEAELASRYDALHSEANQIAGRINDARKRHDLEGALTRQANAITRLRRARDRTVRAMAGSRIVEFIRKRNQANASAVMERAQRLFGRITRHRYELRVASSSEPTFIARDVATGTVHPLDHLSSATRVQLLLAMRVAFLEEQEGGGPQLPLILDELLGNSDDERAGAIIRAILEIARRGRQVFYFTAQHDELAKWISSLSDAERAHCRQVNLCEPDGPAQPPELSSVLKMLTPVPAPGTSSYAEYRDTLDIGPPNLTQPDRIHLWYVLDTVEELHAFLVQGYRCWGQIAHLFDIGGPDALRDLGFDDPERMIERAQARMQVIGRVAELHRIGRGRTVTREIVHRSPISSSKFVADVAHCADESGGDAETLLDALRDRRVKGFGPRQIGRLEAFLEDAGYLDRRATVPPERLKAEIDKAAAPKIASGILAYDDVVDLLERLNAAAPAAATKADIQPEV